MLKTTKPIPEWKILLRPRKDRPAAFAYIRARSMFVTGQGILCFTNGAGSTIYGERTLVASLGAGTWERCEMKETQDAEA